ncbi:transposase [Zavarzinella formosa]|uniref:transposase n=1 Tax=Zavarzinella formosa TaxID=360055 RepID=UPI0003137C28|nr:transposase [Zavarzinella formosa]
MASAHMSDEFYDLVSHYLPPLPPVGPFGGRRQVSHRTVLRMIWFVLVTGCRWEDIPAEFGCSGRTAHRRLRRWEVLGVWDRLHADLLRLLRQADKLDPDTVIVDGVLLRAFGDGEHTGPNPTDRGKTRDRTHLVGRSSWRAAGHPDSRGQRQREAGQRRPLGRLYGMEPGYAYGIEKICFVPT